MIVQACVNGARPAGFHPALPLTAVAMARDAAACIRAGAAEVHLHPRGPDGRESLMAVDTTLRAVRAVCPGSLIGVSTGAWIEGEGTLAAIAAWSERPDYASVNLSEAQAPAVMAALWRQGVGVEAGLASVTDAQRLVALGVAARALRLLIEPPEHAPEAADAILAVLAAAGIRRPVLLHGQGASVWPLVTMAAAAGLSTRVGLEDGDRLPDGAIASGNAALVGAAVALFANAQGR